MLYKNKINIKNNMNSFDNELHVLNKDNLSSIWRRRLLERLRKHIYNFMLERRDENDFFDLDSYNRKYVKDMNVTNDLINIVVLELKSLGWNIFIGFGGTGLYIYSSDELPQGVY